MVKKLRLLLLTLSVSCLLTVMLMMPDQSKAATVYKSVDKQGNVTYSDQPTPGSEKVTIEPQTTVKTPQSQQAPSGPPGQGFLPPGQLSPPGYNNQQQQAPPYGTQQYPGGPSAPPYLNQMIPGKQYYKNFEMTFPVNQQTFHNQRRIIVSFDVQPGLRSGDTIQLFVDGQPYGPPQASTNLLLDNLDRGEHTVSAQLLDRNGRAIFTLDDRTIYIHYASIGPKSVSLEIKKSALKLNKPAMGLEKKAMELRKKAMELKKPSSNFISRFFENLKRALF